MYAAAAEILNDSYDRTVLPLFPMSEVKKEEDQI